MKILNYYQENGLTSDQDIFSHLISTLRPGVADWGYLVDWEKVFNNTRSLELRLNKLNYLLGKEDFDTEFKYLVSQDRDVLKAFPALIVRTSDKTSKFNILTVNGDELVDNFFDFSVTNPSDKDIEHLLKFIRKTGLIRIFEKDGVKNLVDYVLGVEAGLNSNARKNRGGKSMEDLCEKLLINLDYEYIRQATQKQIQDRFGILIKDSEGRQYDFVVKADNGLNIIEVNCFSGGGSKLNKTAVDFISLKNDINNQATFIWITDGFGWIKTQIPLRKSFETIDYILNIHMVNAGALKEIFEKKA